MTKRQNISSGTKWEDVAGYSRAVRIGNIIAVSGTTATNQQGDIVGRGSAYEQTKFIIEKIDKALQEAGASLADVIRTRIYLTDISQWEEASRAHNEAFGNIRPANTMIGINALIGDGYLVEMEADAVITE